MKPDDKPAGVWQHDNMHQRIMCCNFTLYAHGFATDAEYRRIRERIRKWVVKAAGGGR